MTASPSLGPVEGAATLALDGHRIHGNVLSADTQLGFFLFVPSEPGHAPPPQDAAVRIRWKGGDDFRAEARVVETEDADRWVLSVPTQLDPSRQRQATRLLGEGEWSFFSADDQREVEVYDLTAQGLGLAYPRGEGPSGRGVEVSGQLRRGPGETWSVVLECTNVRPHPTEAHLWIVGGRLRHDNDAACAALGQLVASLR